ncbi:hypothetical protein [Nocardia gamkensis]|uniref:hypothetical protein n=1 Tax=Nocardia gamkensis TaxID=352869 RepID=UPI0037C5758C
MEQQLVAAAIEIKTVEGRQRDVYHAHTAFRLRLAELQTAAAVLPRLADAHRAGLRLDISDQQGEDLAGPGHGNQAEFRQRAPPLTEQLFEQFPFVVVDDVELGRCSGQPLRSRRV